MSLDESDNIRGGWPEVFLYNPRIHKVGKTTLKSPLSSTMITRNNAFGKAIVPHFQFASKAKCYDMMRLQYDVVECIPCVLGQLGCEEERSWQKTFGQNEKGGMDEVEFEKYPLTSVVPFYPNAKTRT